MTDTLALQIDLLHQKPIYLLELHPVLVTELLNLVLKALDIGFKACLVLVDRFSEGRKNVQLIFIDEIY